MPGPVAELLAQALSLAQTHPDVVQAAAGTSLTGLAAGAWNKRAGKRLRHSIAQSGTVLRLAAPRDLAYSPQDAKQFVLAYLSLPVKRALPLACVQAWVGMDFVAADGRLEGYLWTPAGMAPQVGVRLRALAPGADLWAADWPELGEGTVARAEFRLARSAEHGLRVPEARETDPLATVLAALGCDKGAQAILQILFRPALWLPRQPGDGWSSEAVGMLFSGVNALAGFVGELVSGAVNVLMPGPPPRPHLYGSMARYPAARTQRKAPAPTRLDMPGFEVAMRLRVAAARPAQAELVRGAVSAAFSIFQAENGWTHRRPWRSARFDRDLQAHLFPTRPVRLTVEELATLAHVPSGRALFAVNLDVGARPQPAPPAPAGARILGRSNYPGRSHPVGLAVPDWRHHAHVVGSTGTGKSTLLLNLAVQDLEAGRGFAVFDPKGDLIEEILGRVPGERLGDVVLLDPSDPDSGVAFNVLESAAELGPERACEDLVAVFKRRYESYWGPRMDDILRVAVLTALQRPNPTLVEVVRLILDPRGIPSFPDDDGDGEWALGLRSFWDWYGSLGESQRLAASGPVLNKMRDFLLRPAVRRLVGQPRSTLSLKRILDGSGVLLLNLSKGRLGEDTSSLLGSLILTRLWQAALSRSSRPEPQRAPFLAYLDEFQNFLSVPVSVERMLAEARAYNFGLVLAHQHLGQLPGGVRDTVSSNARTRIAFQCSHEDARYLARDFATWLTDDDLRVLGRFEIAIRPCVQGRVERPWTAVTLPPSEGWSAETARRVREASRRRADDPEGSK